MSERLMPGFTARRSAERAAYDTPLPSDTRVYCIKTAERIIEILSVSDHSRFLTSRVNAA